jgi:hypothetical protein
MKRLPFFLLLALFVLGCSGEPAPTVGDAEISKGIARKPMPQPPKGMSATSGMTARDMAKLRQGH